MFIPSLCYLLQLKKNENPIYFRYMGFYDKLNPTIEFVHINDDPQRRKDLNVILPNRTEFYSLTIVPYKEQRRRTKRYNEGQPR
jgi:hypothetical protein